MTGNTENAKDHSDNGIIEKSSNIQEHLHLV